MKRGNFDRFPKSNRDKHFHRAKVTHHKRPMKGAVQNLTAKHTPKRVARASCPWSTAKMAVPQTTLANSLPQSLIPNPSLYSHSIVAGGLLLMSYTTRFTPFTSLMIRVEIRASNS